MKGLAIGILLFGAGLAAAQGMDPTAIPKVVIFTDPDTGCDWFITMPSGFTTQRLNSQGGAVCKGRVLLSNKRQERIEDEAPPKKKGKAK